MSLPLSKRALSELLGTYCLILLGCGAMAVDAQSGALTHVGIATTWGLVVMVMIYATGRISGAHMNPAVSVAFAAQGKLPITDCVVYIIAQCVGSIAAAASILAVVGMNEASLGATTTELPFLTAVAVEFVMTAILMMVVMGVSTGAKEEGVTAGIAVGATILMEAMVAGPLTKASMNPARSFGPALVSNDLQQVPIYLVGPFLGALTGALLYKLMAPAGDET
ncbi:MAG: aquaporin [Planctomycetota bacterium]